MVMILQELFTRTRRIVMDISYMEIVFFHHAHLLYHGFKVAITQEKTFQLFMEVGKGLFLSGLEG